MASSHCSLRAANQDNILLENDIDHPDFTGWLYDVTSKQRRWCVLADMLLCVFLRKQDYVPVQVIIVSGSRIIRVLCNSAKLDALDPLRLARVKITRQLPDVTVSGLLKYQFVIEDCFKKTECVFAVDSEALLDKWILMLRLASSLDADVVCDMLNADLSPGTNRCLHKSADSAEKPWNCLKSYSDIMSDNSLPRYIPTTDFRKHRLSCQEPTSRCQLKVNQNELMFSKVIRPNIRDVDDDDDDDDDKGYDKVDDTDCEVLIENPSLVSPVRRSIKLQRQGSFELFKDLLQKKTQVHSMKTKTKDRDNITHQKRSPDQHQSCDVQPNDDMLSIGLSTSFTHQSQMSSYTTSVDSSSNTMPTFAQRIALKASNIRGKLRDHRSKRNTEEDIKSQIKSGCRISGSLLYKQVLRWSKVWCVVSNGYLYVFRRPEDKVPMITTLLVDCSLTSVDHSKFTRHYVFRVCQLSARSLYFQTEEDEFQRWLQVLKEETSTYESFQPMMPLYPELFDESIQDVDLDLNSFSKNQSTTQDSCESIESVLEDEAESVPYKNDNIGYYYKTLNTCAQPKQTTQEKQPTEHDNPGFIQDPGLPIILNPSQRHPGYTCWSLDNYFEQHYLNKFDFSTSCDSLDSWSSDSMLADCEVFEPDVTERSLCDISSGWENGIFQLFPQLSSSLSLASGKRDTSGENTIFNRHLPGPNNEGLLLVVDDFEVSPVHLKPDSAEMTRDDKVYGIRHTIAPGNTKQSEVKRVRHISLSEDDKKDETEPLKKNLSKFKRSLSLTKSFRRNRKPYHPQQLHVNKTLDQSVQSNKHGHLYQYSTDESWKRVWCTLKGCRLDIFISKHDNKAIDSLLVQESTLITELDEGYMGKHYVVQLQHEQNSTRFFAMDTEQEMADWLAHFMVARQSPVIRDKGENQESKELSNQDYCENDREEQPPQYDSSQTEHGQNNLTDKREKTQEVLSDSEHNNSEQLKQEQPYVEVTYKQQPSFVEQPHQEMIDPDQNNLEVVGTQPQCDVQCVTEEQSIQLVNKQQLENSTQMTNDQDLFDKLEEKQLTILEALKKQQEVIKNKADNLTVTQEPNKEWKQLVILKHRKISTELKMESLQRALNSGQTKQHKKSKPKLSLNMLKTQTGDSSPGAECSPEIRHWKHQLETLQKEHRDIVREIENCEVKHSWYKNRHRELRNNVSPSSNSHSLLRENHVEGRKDVRSEVMSAVRSDSNGYQGSVVLTKSKSHSQLSSAGVKQNRLQKIGKRFPNLPLLITRRSLMRRVSNVDAEDMNSVGQESNDNIKVTASPKSLSSGDHSVNESSCANTVLVEKSTSKTTTPRISTSSQQSSPSSESILSSVMMTLNKFMTSPQSEHKLLEGPLSCGNQSVPATNSLQIDASLMPMDDSISPSSEANTSVFTEASLETDSGRGSPIAAEVTEVKFHSNNPARSTDVVQFASSSSSNLVMKSETLANIAAFEDLIHEKLGGLAD